MSTENHASHRARSTVETAVERARAIAPIITFPKVDELLADLDELAASHTDHIERTIIGESRLGEPIPSYAIGTGNNHVVIAGGVHPNEPIGFRTIQELARLLLEDCSFTDGLDATWHLIGTIDPDGTRLNEGWFSNPADRIHYARHFYRPAPDEQVEWTFPFRYKQARFDQPMPETEALIRLFDTVQPCLFVGLHNAELGGVYYYLNRDNPSLVAALEAIPTALGLPLDVGEPEMAGLVNFGRSVFKAPLSRDRYDYLEQLGVDPAGDVSGGGSADYLERYKTATMVAELPYWAHPHAADTTESEASYPDVISEKATALRDLCDTLTATLDRVKPELSIDSPWRRAAEAFASLMGSLADSEAARAEREPARSATRAEVFANSDVVRSFRLRFGGITLHALDAEYASGTATATVRRERDAFAVIYDKWCSEAAAVADIEPLAIELLVGVQLASILVTADAVINDRTDKS